MSVKDTIETTQRLAAFMAPVARAQAFLDDRAFAISQAAEQVAS